MPISRRLPGAYFSLLASLLVLLAACDTSPPHLGSPTRAFSTPTPAPTSTPITPSMTQTVNDITMGIQPIHADSHRISIAISVDGPARPGAYGVALYTSFIKNGPLGISLDNSTEWTWSQSTSTFFGAYAAQGQPLRGQGRLDFFTNQSQPMTATLSALLNIPLLVDNSPYMPPFSVPTSAVPTTETPIPTPLSLPTVSPALLRFLFTTTIPFDSLQDIIQVNQTVENNGVAITLEQADITTSEARLQFRFTAAKPNTFLDADDWTATGTLSLSSGDGSNPVLIAESIEDEEYMGDHGCRYDTTKHPCIISYLDLPLPNKKPLETTLALTATSATTSSVMPVPPPQYGTWTFHFTIPASTK